VEGQRYGLPLADVARVISAVALVPLPGAPAVIRGVFCWHGEMVPTGDLRRRYRLAPREVALEDHIIITRSGDRWLGLLAEGATDIVALAADDISAPDGVAASEIIKGIGRLPDGLILIHDVAAFLSAQEEASLAEAVHARH
jgi:purine-binding chemotaxis protein CheW